VTRKRLATSGERGSLVRLIEVTGRGGKYLVQWGTATHAESLEAKQPGQFRAALEAKGWGLNTVRQTLRYVRGVYNWAERTERLTVNRWHRYIFKVPTGAKPAPRGEYRFEEFVRIWRELDPTKPHQWRAWAITGLLGIYGNRQHAILALQWAWDCGEEIVIPASVEKTGKEAILPMFPLSRRILDVCREWATREGYTGDQVFYPAQAPGRIPSQSAHYTIQSYTDALHRAERRAGVPYLPGRAGHGFRRGLVGDLADETGDVSLALQAIGDSMAMAPRYRVRRDDRIRSLLSDRIADLLNVQPATDSATSPQNPTDHRS
jgi:integrase